MVLPCSRLSICSRLRISSADCAVEVAGGLVADQQRRVGDDRARDRHALLLAAGELRGRCLRAVLQARPAPARSPRCACAARPTAWSAAAAARRSSARSASASGCRTGTRSRRCGCASATSWPPSSLSMRWPSTSISPRGGRVEPADQVEQRGLARAGRAHQRDEVALVDVEVDAVQHLDLLRAALVGLVRLRI